MSTMRRHAIQGDEADAESPGLRKQQSSVRHLQALYTIVAGLALTEAVGTLAAEVDNGLPDLRTLMLMIAFLATVIPFFHGAMRHLDDGYLVASPGSDTSRYSLFVDFVLLFLESVILLGMARRLDDPALFLAFLIALLIVDIVWSVVSHRLARVAVSWRQVFLAIVPGSHQTAVQMRWAQNNLIFIAIATGAALLLSRLDDDHFAEATIVLAVALARTCRDYHLSWEFYFPVSNHRG